MTSQLCGAVWHPSPQSLLEERDENTHTHTLTQQNNQQERRRKCDFLLGTKTLGPKIRLEERLHLDWRTSVVTR